MMQIGSSGTRIVETLFSLAYTCADVALEAAVPILEIYNKSLAISTKADGSPVTEADLAADRIIRSKLQSLWPDIPIISEESSADCSQDFSRYFLVDPLDGTREFINHTGEYTVNIALIVKTRAVMGVIYAPSQNELYIGADEAYICTQIHAGEKLDTRELKPIHIRKANADHLTALSSISHGDIETDGYLKSVSPIQILRSGSSLKFCKIAKGEADFYPRFGPTMAWDIAAGHAILKAAGGITRDAEGEEFHYASSNLRNGPFLAIGDPNLAKQLQPEFTKFCQIRHHAKSDIAE
jgi:3'(2'),5'-bisphosphate nucleotidase